MMKHGLTNPKFRCSVSTNQNILAFPKPMDRPNILVSYNAVDRGLRYAFYTKKYFLFSLYNLFNNIPVFEYTVVHSSNIYTVLTTSVVMITLRGWHLFPKAMDGCIVFFTCSKQCIGLMTACM